MQSESYSSTKSPQPALNLLQRFLQNKNKYRQKYMVFIHQTSKRNPSHGQKPMTSAIGGRPWMARHYSSDNLQQAMVGSSLIKRRNKGEPKKDNYSQDFKQFILSEREKLKLRKRSPQPSVQNPQYSTITHQNIDKQPFLKKDARISIVDLSVASQIKADATCRSSAKENLQGSSRLIKGESIQKWKHYKKKKYIDSRFFSIKRFILNASNQKEREVQEKVKKPCRNMSEIFSNHRQQVGQRQQNRQQQTEIISIEPWDHDPTEY